MFRPMWQKKCRGRLRTTLPTVLNRDLALTDHEICHHSTDEPAKITNLTQDCRLWQELTNKKERESHRSVVHGELLWGCLRTDLFCGKFKEWAHQRTLLGATYDSDGAGRNEDYDGSDTDDDGVNDTDDAGGNVTDDDDGGDDSGPSLSSISEPGLQERAALQVQGIRAVEVCGPPRPTYDQSRETPHTQVSIRIHPVQAHSIETLHTGLYQDTAGVGSQHRDLTHRSLSVYS
ncbi:hypothetical protein ElyMa_006518300 [Elysia marginata]|uniref:Uncharacterized protein n=1 Tax=Elysia marginata TaxID=1093978 RepID=A0AAV4I778_9GAST|nr:hypothetical protein ElyMa_006518300 [Elysia marginata]